MIRMIKMIKIKMNNKEYYNNILLINKSSNIIEIYKNNLYKN
jgi:hypothetical protein